MCGTQVPFSVAACASAEIRHGRNGVPCKFLRAQAVAAVISWQLPKIKRGPLSDAKRGASMRAGSRIPRTSHGIKLVRKPADTLAVRPSGRAAGQGRAPAQRSRSRTTAGTAPRRRSRALPRAGLPCPSARARCTAAPASSCKTPARAVAAMSSDQPQCKATTYYYLAGSITSVHVTGLLKARAEVPGLQPLQGRHSKHGAWIRRAAGGACSE
jgi:hypothetical protein